jgi:hypothetical protein
VRGAPSRTQSPHLPSGNGRFGPRHPASALGIALAGAALSSCWPTPPPPLPPPIRGGASTTSAAAEDAPATPGSPSPPAPSRGGGSPPLVPAGSSAAPERARQDRAALLPQRCTAAPERAETPPPSEPGRELCAYYRGCPGASPTRSLRRCPPATQTVAVRDLRDEGGARRVGSPIAVRGVAVIWHHPKLSSFLSRRPRQTATCPETVGVLTLASDGRDACIATNLTLPESLLCRGDTTDVCCHANPALPKQGTVAVAVGMYLGTSPLWPEGEVDDIAVEYFCTLPNPSGGKHQP